jgi:hypothetical protein
MTSRSSDDPSKTYALGWGRFSYRTRSRFDYRAHESTDGTRFPAIGKGADGRRLTYKRLTGKE